MLYIKILNYTDCWRSVGVCALNDGLLLIIYINIAIRFEDDLIDVFKHVKYAYACCRGFNRCVKTCKSRVSVCAHRRNSCELIRKVNN